MRQFAVIAESAAELVDTGVNTLQQTALLRKAAELRDVDRELVAKRETFAERMEAIGKRQAKLNQDREDLRVRMLKFDKFVRENNAKRERATQKFKRERIDKEQKSRDLEELLAELEARRKQADYMKEKLARYVIFQVYLQQVIDSMPEGFLDESCENLVYALINRHEGLCATKLKLEQRSNTISEELHERGCSVGFF